MSFENVGAVVIGRNEGQRLARCLSSLSGSVDTLIYVDSGSTDGSIELARELGAEIVELDLTVPFTAARARNAGLLRLTEIDPGGDFVQFVDGDCEVESGWIKAGVAAIERSSDTAVVCGRRREIEPEASIYNRLIDREWDTPLGEVKSCGGDALIRRSALGAVGGFDPAFIAGEEPELCCRLRNAGWKIVRIDEEMTRHDARLLTFGQWWTRARRGGYAYGLLNTRHGRPPERAKSVEVRRVLVWGVAIPMVLLASAFVSVPMAFLIALLYPAQIVRQRLKGTEWKEAFFLLLAKFPEALGLLEQTWHRLTGQRRRLIEYKS